MICLNLVKELLGRWRDDLRRHRSLNVWNAIPLCLIWCASLLKLKTFYFSDLFDWIIG